MNNLLDAIIAAKLAGGSGGGGGGGGGLTDDVKQALMDVVNNVAWINGDGQQYIDELEAALYPLSYITAVYTQSGTVYTTDSLDSLKADLVVTAFYQGGNSKTITDYTLSGTLTEGTSTITVSYGGKTATFEVTVSGAQALWELKNEVFSGGNITTNQPICESDMDFTIAIDIVLNTNPSSGNGSTYRLPRILNIAGTNYALAVQKQFGSDAQLTFTYMGSNKKIGSSAAGRKRFVIYHAAGSGKATIQFRQDDGELESVSITATHTNTAAYVVIGQTTGTNQLPPGTLNHGIIYDIVWDQDAINEFLGVTVAEEG